MLSRFYCTCRAFGSASCLALLMLTVLSACGGGGSSKKNVAIASSATNSSSFSAESSLSSNPAAEVTLSGLVTYDRVPHNTNHIGLNYSATLLMPVRGALVELLNAGGSVIASGSTDSTGQYLLSAPQNTMVKVRVKAELLQATSPTWNFKVTDNTNNNAVYALTGALATTGNGNSQRNLHAASGWNGVRYSAIRAAAPFAILDNIYNAATRLSAAGNTTDLQPLELRWSTNNNAADGEIELGEIGTSYFDSTDSAIYILGDANNDIDEYDSHVVAHEWAHYLEQNLFRSDSIGGNHSQGDKLDMRVSMSEGFSNAFASMLLDDPYYADSSGSAQSQGFFLNVAARDNSLRGFYSEDSIGSIFYNYYLSSTNKIANDFAPLFSVLSNSSYLAHDAMTSIFLFYAQFKALLPDKAIEFGTLMQEQHIFGTTEYAENETNDAGYSGGLPLYKVLQPDVGAVNICSTAEFGKYNKYGNSQLLKLTVLQDGSYTFSAVKSGGASVASRPEMIIFKRGAVVTRFLTTINGEMSGSLVLAAGTYIVEVYDANNRNENNLQQNTTCFNVQVVTN